MREIQRSNHVSVFKTNVFSRCHNQNVNKGYAFSTTTKLDKGKDIKHARGHPVHRCNYEIRHRERWGISQCLNLAENLLISWGPGKKNISAFVEKINSYWKYVTAYSISSKVKAEDIQFSILEVKMNSYHEVIILKHHGIVIKTVLIYALLYLLPILFIRKLSFLTNANVHSTAKIVLID